MDLRALFFACLCGTVLPLANAQSPTAATPNPADYDAGPVLQAGLADAKFRWWAPPGVKLRGVLVLIPGRSGDGRGMAANPEWQALAAKAQFGIVACALINPQDNPYQYQNDPNGATTALIDSAVKTVLAQNKVPLQNPPLAFWGHSAGGIVSQNYCSRHPERVVGAVLLRSPRGPGGLAPGKEAIPLLVLVGKKDKPEWVQESLANYEKGHGQRAVWTLAAHPNEGHEAGKTQPLALAHLAAAIALRLPPPGGFSSEAVRPRRLSRESGWLGDPATGEIGTALTFKGKKADATWLLDESTAKAWQAYLQGQ